MSTDRRDLSEFYNQAWRQWDDMVRFSPAPRFRRRMLLSWMKELRLDSLLDVGCGNGVFLWQAARQLGVRELAGADISSMVIEANRRGGSDIAFHVLDLNQEVLPRRFDAVVCMELVEHCLDYRDAISRLAEMTGKWLLLSVPCGPVFPIDRMVGHVRHFTPKDIESALVEAGLRPLKIQQWGFPFFNLYKHLINLSPQRMCDSFLGQGSYGPWQKIVSALVYYSFFMCLPARGYQLLAMAERRG